MLLLKYSFQVCTYPYREWYWYNYLMRLDEVWHWSKNDIGMKEGVSKTLSESV